MISVILATKNGSTWIDRAVESVLNQTEKDIELIVISDGSTDNTPQKVRHWVGRDNRVRLIEQKENTGPGKARAHGIAEARGNYIALIDDDDYWISKNKLHLQSTHLDTNPDCVLVGAYSTDLVHEDGSLIKIYTLPQTDADIRKNMLLKNCFMTSTVMFRKDAYTKAGGFDTLYLAEDYDLWLRMGLVGTFANLEGIDTAYTIRTSSASKERQAELSTSVLSIVWKYKNNYPNAALGIIKSVGRYILFHLKKIF